MSKKTSVLKKAQLGQFFTPESTAQFMAGFFPQPNAGVCRLLDAGAGIGSLSSAFLQRCVSEQWKLEQIHATAYELDEELHADLANSMQAFASLKAFSYQLEKGDFIEAAVNNAQFSQAHFTHAILNPPYKKVNSHSRHRQLLREVGVETVNLYAAFVALAILLMKPGGQIVAIIPRSFCNGPYYRPFREFLLQRAAIRQIHLFDSRRTAFKDDAVLQENVIIRLECGAQQGDVTISTSTDDSLFDLNSHDHPFERIVAAQDAERIIHIPTSLALTEIEQSLGICHSLAQLGLSVSTGPVVDFRAKQHLRAISEAGSVPLIYPAHFVANGLAWPKLDMKKPNAIMRNPMTEKSLYPAGFYCVVRRFSSKEEKRRIIARALDPAIFDGASMLGFENHLNLFHMNKQGLPPALAHGLAVFLNSSAVDESFRRFNGHTQVNATDLKLMLYPSTEVLTSLGNWAMQQSALSQEMIDQKLKSLQL